MVFGSHPQLLPLPPRLDCRQAPEAVVFDRRVAKEAPKPWMNKRQTVAPKKDLQKQQQAATPQGGYAAELAAAAVMNASAYADTDAATARSLRKEAIPISEMNKRDRNDKSKTFAAKEKRKRDSGQSSRKLRAATHCPFYAPCVSFRLHISFVGRFATLVRTRAEVVHVDYLRLHRWQI